MAKQLNVNLNYTANTAQAQQALNQLSVSLNSIANITPTAGVKLSQDLQIAKQSAQQLQQHLINAFNVKTGNLDLGRLDASLKSAGQSLGGLSTNLLKAGTTGQQAFLNIQRAISNASVQINQANGMLAQFWTTLQNTARWQISSSILHGFVSSLQSAWGYAKDLDKSLNNIRIVTGYNTERMAEFAEYANKAAKALSTTTTSFTDASLIYYQQGLSEKEVLERAEITVKMANVTGKNAQEVSDQLTAIWNNFDNGSKSLEYYVDVITALGAATASSTDEISQGLEKFAAVAETAGLSYEYATAALATVTAETRQSADVVGTAFKTLFARIQGLKLGETLDDGTTLNSYSEALMKVGINIKDSNGELKDMDIILNEMGSKWNNLARDQQVALAQAVGGIRQYNQLIALMDNWDVFQTNLQTIETSTGALQQQADIYADSWEAASNRVKAAAEGIYRDLFPTEELTGVADGFATFLQGVDGLVRGLGGLKGILLLISSIVLNSFQNQMGTAIDNMISKVSSLSSISINLKNAFTGVVGSTKNLSNTLDQVRSKTQDGAAQAQIFEEHLSRSASLATKNSNEMGRAALNTTQLSDSFRAYSTNLLEVNNVQALIEKSSKYLTSEQKQQLSLLQQQALAANEQLLIAQDQYQLAQQRSALLINSTGDDVANLDRFRISESGANAGATNFDSGLFASKSNVEDVTQMNALWQQITGSAAEAAMTVETYKNHISMALGETTDLEAINKQVKATYADIYSANQQIQSIMQSAKKDAQGNVQLTEEEEAAIRSIVNSLKTKNATASKVLSTMDAEKGTIKDIIAGIEDATTKTRKFAIATGSSEGHIQQMEGGILKTNSAFASASTAAENFKNKVLQVTTTLQNGLANAMSVGHIVSSMASGFSTIAMGISSVTNAIETFKDEEASFATKLTSGAIAATMGVSALMATIQGISSFIESINIAMGISNGIKAVNNALTAQSISLTSAEGKAKAAELIVQKLDIAEDKKEMATKAALQMLDKKDIATTYKKVAADYANVASQAAKLWYITLIIAAIAAVIAITVALINAESEEERQVRQTATAYEEMKESMEENKQVAEDLKSIFSQYTEIQEQLAACTKGTEEWNEALIQSEQLVLQLLRDFPHLAYQYDNLFVRDPETGTLQMDSGTIQLILDEYNLEGFIDEFQATTSSLTAQQALQKQNLESSLENPTFANHLDWGLGGYAMMGRPFVKEHLSELINLTPEDFRKTFKDLWLKYTAADGDRLKNLKSHFTEEEFNQKLDAWVDGIATNLQDDFDLLGNTTKNLTDAMSTAYDMIVQRLIPEESAEVQNLVSADVERLTKKYTDAYEDLMTSSGGKQGKNASIALVGDESLNTGINIWSEKDNKIYDYILKELNKYGKQWIADTSNAVQGTDGDRYLQFIDENGDHVRKSAKWIAQELGSSRALAEINNSVTTAEDLLSKINTNIENANFGKNESGQQIAFKALMTDKHLGNVSVGNIKDLYDAADGLVVENGAIVQKDGDGTLTKEEVGAYIDKIVGDGKDGTISNDTAKKYGFNDAADMIDTYYRNLNAAGTSIKNFAISGIKEIDSLTLGAAEKLNTTFNRINLGPAGELAGQQFVKGINKMLDQVDESKRSSALEKLTSVDWSSYDALDQAAKIMKEFGVVIDTTSEEWINYANSMRIATNATPDFTKLKNDLIAISNILKDLKFGSTLKEEDYQALIAYNSAWADFFVLQADGTRKFIGNEKDLQRATRDTIKINQEKMAQDKAHADAIKNKGIDVTFDESEVETNAGGDGKDGKFDFKFAQEHNTKGYQLLTGMGYTVDSDGKVKDKDGKEISNDDASAKVMAASRGDKAEGLINNNPEVMAALESQGYSKEQINEIIAEAKAGNDERLQVLMNGLGDLVNQNYDLLGQEYEEMLASTATSLADLDNLSSNNNFSPETQQKALIGLASAYEDCRDEVIEYQEALASNDPNKIAKAEEKLRKSLRDREWRKATKAVKGYYNEIKNLHDAEEIAQKQKEIANALNDLFGTNITSAFVRENWALFDEWANATGDRATELALEIQSKAVLASTKASDILNNTTGTIQVDLNGDGVLEQFTDRWSAMKAIIEANPITIGANGKADLTSLITSLLNAGYTAQEVANYLASIGQTEVEVSGYGDKIPEPPTDVTSPEWAEWWNENFKKLDGGVKVTSASVPSRGVADMSTIKDGGSGGGGDKKKADKKKKKDVVDRYKEVTDALNENATAIEQASAAADRMYGSARIEQMEKVNALLKKEIDLMNKKRKEAALYLAQDKQALQNATKEAGINFTFDENGNISNYTEEMSKLYEQLDAVIEKANKNGNADEKEQKAIDKIQEKIDKVKDAQADYEETLATMREIDQSVIEKFNEWQDKNFEMINAKVELRVELNDRDIALIESTLNKLSEDVYASSEALALMWGQGDKQTQLDIYQDKIAAYQDSVDKLTEAYNKGEISHASFVEGLKTAQDGILDEVENIQDLDQTMSEYYSETLSSVNDELSKYTDLIEGATTALEHFSSMMELLGKQTDYEAMGVILAAQAEVAETKYNTSARAYQMMADAAKEKKAAYDAVANDDSIADVVKSQLEKDWMAAEQAAQEAQDQMLSDAETWAEALTAILDNALAGFAQELEESLTGEFKSFENLSTQLERANSLQEEYLTTTNKIYETNKMMRNAQKEIDKTTNSMAKQKLKQFITETAAMQEQGKLSQYELDVQQAKYDLLLAEIALREAQNAKSTVRLQRDSEGNFGYVYTADQNAVADAQQKFEDAQNALYNKGLEGANDYAQKSIELQQEYLDTIADINERAKAGEFASDAEHQAALTAAWDYYYEQLKSYSSLYQVATTTDSRVVADAWSSDFSSMVTSTETWKNKTVSHINEVNKVFADWSGKMNTIKDNTVGKDLAELSSQTAQLANNAKELANKLLAENGVIAALEQELDLVGQVTTAYAQQRDALESMLNIYKEYLELLGIEIKEQSNKTGVLETGMGVTVKANVKNWSKTDDSTLGNVIANGQYQVLAYTSDEVQISNSTGSTGWVKKSDLVGFDTGGYTGSWGSYGKLAMLHEKEMVLNKQDTENLLASMEFLSHILEMIDLQALSNQLGGVLTMPSLSHHSSETLEQNVHIEASFPGVSDRNEIEEAFNNLINTASQYANRK